MDSQNETAYCGIYCPDCIHYKNKYSIYARKLNLELENKEFAKYAEIDSPFGEQFQKYKEFTEVLKALSNTQCTKTCRVGGGCSGIPCKIMECCHSNGYDGCWECKESESCNKFDFLQPRCGEMPKKNIKKIKEHGIQNWVDSRHIFYIWQTS